jgi:hypothetical protein
MGAKTITRGISASGVNFTPGFKHYTVLVLILGSGFGVYFWLMT